MPGSITSSRINGPRPLLLAVPIAIAGVGLIEWVSGTPLNEMGQQWTFLESWQRAVILASLIGIAGAILLSGAVFVMVLLSGD